MPTNDFKHVRINTNYDWRVMVRVTGERDGWNCTLVDTPVFELRSNVNFGGVWTRNDAAVVACDMFYRLALPGDEIRVDIANLEGGDQGHYTWTVE